eukprot:Em0013g1a
MLRYFQQVNRIVLTTLALLCGLCMSDDPVACTQLANMTCQAVQDASVEYSLNVSSTTYHESQLLSITISRNRCPNFEEYGGFTEDTPKKSWNYTITAISSSNQAPIGYFKVPSGSRLEIDSCNHSTVLLFSTCEASPVDLPRTYDWVAPPTTAGNYLLQGCDSASYWELRDDRKMHRPFDLVHRASSGPRNQRRRGIRIGRSSGEYGSS